MSRGFALAMVVVLLSGCGGSSSPPEPAPTVLSVAPPGGPVAGGTDVVVRGASFQPGATVRFDAAAATSVVWVSATELHARTPAHAAGAVAVAVENPSGKAESLPDGFTYALPPTAAVAGTLRAPVGTPVLLDGALSTDPSLLPLTWQWTLLAAPAGSTAALADAATSIATLTPDLPGRYAASLVLTNPGGASEPATAEVVTITTGSRVPDTGQRTCYGESAPIPCPALGAPFDGQDAQFVIRPSTLAADAETVTDAVTGLVWQRATDPAKHNFYEAAGIPDPVYNPPPAVDVCGGLVLGGRSDWRLPTRRELLTLVRWEGNGELPSGDTQAFPDLVVELGPTYWTSSRYDAQGMAWTVEFLLGLPTAGFGSLATGHRVRCVRGAAWGVNAFVDQGDGTVRDDGTGLVWEQAPANLAYTWAEALAHCATLPLAGGGWRLPSANELDALIDGLRNGRALDPVLFPGAQLDRYWTSTSVHWAHGAAMAGNMSIGWLDGPYEKSTSYHARCVR